MRNQEIKINKSPDLIVVSSPGFDSEGWPLGSQLDVCDVVAQIYKDAPSDRKPLILANALGLPNRYRVDDPVLGKPVVQSRQTELLLANLGVDQKDIVRGQLAIETIGEGLELFTLLSPGHDNVGWLKDYAGNDPIVWTSRAAEFQRSLSEITPHIIFAGADYQVTRSAVINMHMLDLAGQPFTTEILPVPVAPFARVNAVGTAEEMQAHIKLQTERFQKEWQSISEPDQFFDALRERHGLFNQGEIIFHSDREKVSILDHADRTDHARLYAAYRKPEWNATFVPGLAPSP
jgi:hypothetical protein